MSLKQSQVSKRRVICLFLFVHILHAQHVSISKCLVNAVIAEVPVPKLPVFRLIVQVTANDSLCVAVHPESVGRFNKLGRATLACLLEFLY